MGRLVRIVIYSISIILLYFLVVNAMDMYAHKDDTKIDDQVLPDSIQIDMNQIVEDTIMVDSVIAPATTTVNNDLNYDKIDKKVSEIEKNKPAPTNIVKNKGEALGTEHGQKHSESTKPAVSSDVVFKSDVDGRFLVLAGSFLLKENADALVAKLKKIGYQDAKVVVFTSSQYHSVLAAQFNSEERARSVSAQLKQKGIENFVKMAQ